MIGAIAVVSVAIWFYFTAQRFGENGIKWAFFGILNYYLPAVAWHVFVSQPLMGMVGSGSTVLRLIIGYSFVFFGVAVAAYARNKLLVKGRTSLKINEE
ncbi:MAG: hypothetical protein ABFS02_08820 [Pseudomonadota bacterium]